MATRIRKQADAFARVHAPVSPSIDRVLLEAIADRLRGLDLPVRRAPRRWHIGDVSQMSSPDLKRALIARVRLALRHGVEVQALFEVREPVIWARAERLAQSVYDGRGNTGEAAPATGHDRELQVLGRPPADVSNIGRWYRRVLLQFERRISEYFSMLMGSISRYTSPIVSSMTLASRSRQLAAQQEFASRHELVRADDSGAIRAVPFAEASCTAHKRMAKTYVRLKGQEEFFDRRGLVGHFITLTLPSRYHPNPAKGRKQWDGVTPIQGHNELQRRWRMFQRRFGEQHGKCFGVRVEEPHDDGCPHWHALIYVAPGLEGALRHHIGEAFGRGVGVEVSMIDSTIGSGASYLLKYINPVLHTESEPTSPSTGEKAARYDAHRAVWGGRSIQFFDVPGSSTIWDEMRRIKTGSPEHELLGGDASRLHAAAAATCYAEFLEVLTELREQSPGSIDVAYRRLPHGRRAVVGVRIANVVIPTRKGGWTIRQRPTKKLP